MMEFRQGSEENKRRQGIIWKMFLFERYRNKENHETETSTIRVGVLVLQRKQNQESKKQKHLKSRTVVPPNENKKQTKEGLGVAKGPPHPTPSKTHPLPQETREKLVGKELGP